MYCSGESVALSALSLKGNHTSTDSGRTPAGSSITSVATPTENLPGATAAQAGGAAVVVVVVGNAVVDTTVVAAVVGATVVAAVAAVVEGTEMLSRIIHK